MMLRYLTAVIALVAVGAGLLGLRMQQLNHRHELAVLHSQMRKDREQIQELQVRIARQTSEESLREAIRRLDLQLEPIGNEQTPGHEADTLAEASP